VEELQHHGLAVNGVQYSVIWYCCSDWTFLAMVYGLNSSTAKFFCIWCYCTKANIADFSIQDWPIQRTLEDCHKQCSNKTTEKRKGCVNEPLLSIPFDHVIVDTLHLFLRIMGLLFRQIIELVLNNGKKEVLETELERINVPFKFYEVQSEQGTTETKWTRLDGKDLHNILENLELKPIFNGVPATSRNEELQECKKAVEGI